MEITQRQIEPSFITEDWFVSMPADYQHLYMIILLSCDNASGVWRPKRTLSQMYLGKMIMFDTFLEKINKDDNGNPCRRIVVTSTGNWVLLQQMKATIGVKFSGSGPKISLLKKIVANDLFPKDFPEFDWSGLETLDNDEVKSLLLHNPMDTVREHLRKGKGRVGLRYNIPTNNPTHNPTPDNDVFLESNNTEESKHSKGGDSQGEGETQLAPVKPVAAVFTGPNNCQVRVSKAFRNGLVLSVQQLYDTPWDRYINLHPSMDMSVTEQDFTNWRNFVDLLIKLDIHDVFKVELFITPADLKRLVEEKGFTTDLWEPVMMRMAGTGFKPEINLFMRIPQFMAYVKSDQKTTATRSRSNETVASVGNPNYVTRNTWGSRAANQPKA